jgi:putative ABC transport system permease protein
VSLPYLLLVNLRRNLVRSLLTGGAVAVAMFLYCFLHGILDTLQDSIEVGSESRLVTRNAISIIFDLPLPYRERIKAVPGVEEVTYSNWFGAQDPADPRGFFPQFGIDAATWVPMYASEFDIVDSEPAQPGASAPAGCDPKLAAFFADQTGAIVGEKLMQKKGWNVGQTVTLAGTIYPGDHPFTVKAVYRARNKTFGDEQFMFHWKYLNQLAGEKANAGTYTLSLKDPSMAAAVAGAVDDLFEMSADRTKTETERAFSAGFISMYGNVPFVIRVVGLAVVFAILLVAANAMMMGFRERTTEIGVLKTLGFPDGTVFGLVLAEAAVLTLLGGALGGFGAKALIEGTGFNAGGMLPPMSVHDATVGVAMGLAAGIGFVAGVVPATLALRLPIVNALRRA